MAKIKVCSPYHIQFIGKVIVNFYPTKNKAYINRTVKGFSCTEKLAKQIADNPEKIPDNDIVKAKRKMGNARKRKRLYYQKGITRCYVCDNHMEFEETTLEHIIPLAKGGSNRDDNLSLSHEKCNLEKGAGVHG